MPFADLFKTVAKNDVRIIAYLALIVAILQLVAEMRDEPPPAPVPPQVTVEVNIPTDEIVRRVREQLEREAAEAGPCLPPEQVDPVR